MGMAQKRIRLELRKIREKPPIDCSVWEIDDFNWTASVLGPANSPYEDGVFFLRIHFPFTYPFHPPDFPLLTPIYHPNVSARGEICRCFLKQKWSPALTASTVLLTMSEVMAAPCGDDHVMLQDIAKVFRTNKPRFEELARKCTLQYAV